MTLILLIGFSASLMKQCTQPQAGKNRVRMVNQELNVGVMSLPTMLLRHAGS